MTPRVVTLVIPGRPALLNAERSGNHYAHRQLTKTVRSQACILLGREGRKGQMGKVKVDVWSNYADRRLPDTAACLPAVKACIDGAVDAGLLLHDGPAVVRHVAFWAPRTDPEVGNQLLMAFEELPEKGSPWSEGD